MTSEKDPIDYKVIRAENEKFYGTGVNQWAPKLLADRYDDRTHFIWRNRGHTASALGADGQSAIDWSLCTPSSAGSIGPRLGSGSGGGVCPVTNAAVSWPRAGAVLMP